MNLVFKNFEDFSREEILDFINDYFIVRYGLSDDDCIDRLRMKSKYIEEQYFYEEESNE